ncbi:MAG: ATP-dependent Clp protease proteolytic subunit [Bacilli bacterium]|nr:ATP-dependent Clp protease proteolytic subunit [Bacilli bacterium]
MNLIIPTIVENTNEGITAYDIFSRLLKERIIVLTGEIEDNMSSLIVSELLYLDSISHDDIHLYINSPGGSVSAGLAIYDTMNLIKSDVNTYGVGLSASMGAFLLAGGTKGKRNILENAEVMIHEVASGVSGKSTEIEAQTEHLKKVKNRVNKILAINTNKSIKQIEKDTKIDNYMNAEEALKYHLVDKIIK